MQSPPFSHLKEQAALIPRIALLPLSATNMKLDESSKEALTKTPMPAGWRNYKHQVSSRIGQKIVSMINIPCYFGEGTNLDNRIIHLED
jgi:hypothetical protein